MIHETNNSIEETNISERVTAKFRGSLVLSNVQKLLTSQRFIVACTSHINCKYKSNQIEIHIESIVYMYVVYDSIGFSLSIHLRNVDRLVCFYFKDFMMILFYNTHFKQSGSVGYLFRVLEAYYFNKLRIKGKIISWVVDLCQFQNL